MKVELFLLLFVTKNIMMLQSELNNYKPGIIVQEEHGKYYYNTEIKML